MKKIYNVHHASLEYKGLDAIYKILKDKKLNQYARIHIVEKN